MKKMQYIVGIDEAGRGPLAGPVAVGIVIIPKGFSWKVIPGVTDSKKLSETKREKIFMQAKLLKQRKELNYAVSMVSANVIDRIGITKAVALGIMRGLKKLHIKPRQSSVRLDGLLSAPPEYVQQQTIIKGDAKEKVIGLASIMAKVTRDAYMVRISRNYKPYAFDVHKGYGTKFHRTVLQQNGLSRIHRKTFCKNFQ